MHRERRSFTLAAATLAATIVAASVPARAADDAVDARALAHKAQATISAFSGHKDFPTLGPALAKAKAVLIFPQILKAGFVLGGSGGSGVLLVHDEKTGQWSEPVFYTMGSASLGFQAGASAAEVVMIVNSQKALDALYTSKLKLGGDASVAVGPKGVGTGASLSADFVAYSAVKGAFAGMAVDGSVLEVRDSLNKAYYAKPVTPIDIAVKHAATNADSAGLRATVKKAEK
jgi:lipid-binding SYLF domain-containing protein